MIRTDDKFGKRLVFCFFYTEGNECDFLFLFEGIDEKKNERNKKKSDALYALEAIVFCKWHLALFMSLCVHACALVYVDTNYFYNIDEYIIVKCRIIHRLEFSSTIFFDDPKQGIQLLLLRFLIIYDVILSVVWCFFFFYICWG